MLHRYDSDLNPSRPVRSSPLGSSIDTGLPLELVDRLKAFPLFQSAPESFLLSIGKSLRPNVYQPAQDRCAKINGSKHLVLKAVQWQ